MAQGAWSRISAVSLLLAGMVFGMGLMLNCGGGGGNGGTPADAANGTFAGVLHVDPDPGGPHPITYEPDHAAEIRSIMFTPQGPNDMLLAVMAEGTYSTAAGEVTLHLHVMFDNETVAAGYMLELVTGQDQPFQIHLPIHGSVLGSSGAVPPTAIGLRAFASSGLAPPGQILTTIERIDFKLLWLEDVTVVDPTGAAAPNPLDVDADGDGFTLRTRDCDDTDPAIYPTATELLDGVDNNCNGLVDEGFPFLWYWQDADGDGYGRRDGPMEAQLPPPGYVTNNFDCDDGDSAINPGATEVADGVDNDCNGQVDETEGTIIWYMDNDEDGYGGSSELPPGWNGYPVSLGGDCDDDDATVFPGAPELADGKDNDCDSSVDES